MKEKLHREQTRRINPQLGVFFSLFHSFGCHHFWKTIWDGRWPVATAVSQLEIGLGISYCQELTFQHRVQDSKLEHLRLKNWTEQGSAGQPWLNHIRIIWNHEPYSSLVSSSLIFLVFVDDEMLLHSVSTMCIDSCVLTNKTTIFWHFCGIHLVTGIDCIEDPGSTKQSSTVGFEEM